MPFAFPSHQGLIAPLWRRWPNRFNILAMGIGAAVPDIVDGIAGGVRGGLGQWYGHTLIGLVVLCLPTGLLVTWAAIRLANALAKMPAAWGRFGRYLQSLNNCPPGTRAKRFAFVAISAELGALSHILIDFISHGNFLLLYPWYRNPRFFPEWWYIEWFRFSLPGYRNPYIAGPHLAVWSALSLLGIVLFIYPFLKRNRKSD